MERMTFVVFLCACRVSLTGFMAPFADLALGRAAAAARPLPQRPAHRSEKDPAQNDAVCCLSSDAGAAPEHFGSRREGFDRQTSLGGFRWCSQPLGAGSAHPQC